MLHNKGTLLLVESSVEKYAAGMYQCTVSTDVFITTFIRKYMICKNGMEIVDLLTWCLKDKVSYCRLAPVVGEVTVE